MIFYEFKEESIDDTFFKKERSTLKLGENDSIYNANFYFTDKCKRRNGHCVS